MQKYIDLDLYKKHMLLALLICELYIGNIV